MNRACPHEGATHQPHPTPSSTRKRRPHKKSRTGCENCKRRRVKCDEQRPSCSNCISFSLSCDFDPASAVTATEPICQTEPLPTKRRRGRPRKDWTSLPSNPKPAANPAQDGVSLSKPPSFDMDDMELFHHYLTDPILQQGDVSLWRDRVPLLAFRHPCVLHLLLAVSALHLARLQPPASSDETARYRRLAEQRATVGLRETTQMLPRLNRENCGALYIAAVLVFTFSLAKGPGPKDMFFVGEGGEAPWWEPMRGVRFVLGTMGPEAIFSGVLAPQEASNSAQEPQHPTPPVVSGRVPSVALEWEQAVRHVSDLVDSSLSQDTDMFRSALDGLAGCFRETFGTPDEPKDSAVGRFEVVMAWVYRLDDGFTPQVSQQNPVALVLLAHFAVLLKTMEYAWFMEGWASHILDRVTQILGPRFTQWLRWPTETITALAASQGDDILAMEADPS